MRKRTACYFMLGITVATVGAMLWVPGESALVVRARQVEVRRIEERVDGGGVLGRSGEYTVSSLAGGVIAQVFVEANQRVQSGQALFRLDSAAQEQALETSLRASSQGRLAQAAALEDAQATWKNGADWVAQAQGEQNRQQTDLLKAQISAMTVRAQEGGEVLNTYIHAGEVLLPGAPALTLAQEAQVVRLQVGEREALRLHTGLRARLLRDDVLLGQGTVNSVGVPQIRQDGVLSVSVEVTPDQPVALPYGSRLDVEIICRTQEGATLVPLEAMDGDEQAVWQVYKQRAWRVPVSVGLQDELHVAVSGLEADAWIIMQPSAELRPGELVEVKAP